MAQFGIIDMYRLRSELDRLKTERVKLLQIACAALVLVNDLDSDTYESYEAAELVADCLNHLPDPVMNEVLGYSRS
ncbi:MAG: hypothetical protein LLG15_13620 [Betaproteobacteria bacterium]|nr:hypothetical protein [Betaproteobacteria bacterium]